MVNCVTEEPQPHYQARQCQEEEEEGQQVAAHFAHKMEWDKEQHLSELLGNWSSLYSYPC